MLKYIEYKISFILLLFTPYLVIIANKTRPQFAIGGEVLVWTFPILIAVFLGRTYDEE